MSENIIPTVPTVEVYQLPNGRWTWRTLHEDGGVTESGFDFPTEECARALWGEFVRKMRSTEFGRYLMDQVSAEGAMPRPDAPRLGEASDLMELARRRHDARDD